MHDTLTVDLDGRSLTIETGKLAKQSDGAAVVKCGDTVVLVTACYSKEAKDIDFLPLTVEYKEYQYAAGRIPGGFFKREGRPTEKEILTCRMIDRPFRPLFPEGFNHETQIVGLVLSADGENDPDVLAINGAAAALAINTIPFHHILGAVRVGRIGERFVFNPTAKERKESQFDLMVVGTHDAVSMVEAGAKEVSEAVMLEAILRGHEQVRKIVEAIAAMAARRSVVKAPFTSPAPVPADFAAAVRSQWEGPMMEALTHPGKIESYAKIKEVKKYGVEVIPEDQPETRRLAKRALSELVETLTRETIVKQRKRLDGRAFDQIRPITIEAGVLPRTHGSSLFTRGETQALVTVTLGTSDDTQLIEDLEGESERAFLLHYNFPPFSVGEVKRFGSPGRREIGHGRLAWRSLQAVLPDEKEFPYTIRVVSDILESNGSSSMATICGGSLALMDAGVPVKGAVAGVAMGLVKEGDAFAVLTDIAGQEDHYGDMDFKVAGTRTGITALQMDIKIGGITPQIFQQALEQARQGRLFILDKMEQTLERRAPRALRVRAAPADDHGARGEDPRRHRLGRQDDPRAPEGIRLQDRRAGRRHRHRRLERPRDRREVHRGDPPAHDGARDRHRVPRHGHAHRALRLLRADPPGHGRARPHLRARAGARARDDRRREDGRQGQGQDHRDRPRQREDQALAPAGAHAGRDGRRDREARSHGGGRGGRGNGGRDERPRHFDRDRRPGGGGGFRGRPGGGGFRPR